MALESIAFIPSGYKANKLYCQLPVDGGADLTTSRASGATRVNKNGLIEDVATGVPRLDYTNGGCPELLLEPQSTNEITYSEDFTDASWVKANTSISANVILSPDGSVNASKLISSATSTSHYLRINVTSVSDATLSFFIKKAEEDIVFVGNSTSTQGAEFDLTNGVVNSVTGGSADIVDYGNGWYRCSYTRTSFTDWQYLSLRGNFTSYLGDGTSGVYVFGAQFEQLSYSPSYIRTSGTTVTRIADAVTGNSSLGQVINSSEGVLYVEMSALADDSSIRQISLTNGSSSVYVRIEYSNASNRLIFSTNVATFMQTFSYTITDTLKLAFKYKENDFAMWVNGTEVITDPAGGTFASGTLTKLSLDNGVGGSPFYGRIRELKVYDTALTDAELQTLTTI